MYKKWRIVSLGLISFLLILFSTNFQYVKAQDTGSTQHPVTIYADNSYGRILVADSLTYFHDVSVEDVVVGASFAGVPTAMVPLKQGIKGWIAHEAGVGKDEAGISGLPFSQDWGIPAAAVATMSARLSDGDSLLKGIISHANEVAIALGVKPGQTGAEAAELMLKAAPGRAVTTDNVDARVHPLAQEGERGIYAVWSLMLIEQHRPNDVFCVASHSARVMAEYAESVMPLGIIANDAGMGMEHSGIDGLPILDDKGIAAAAVDTMSARIGNPLSTYHDGIISAVNQLAKAKGVRVGMPAKQAADLMLKHTN